MTFPWRCPFCNHNATITKENHSTERHEFYLKNKYGSQVLKTNVVSCPNPKCAEIEVKASLHNRKIVATAWTESPAREEWQLIPSAEMKVFPDYVPKPILVDYQEACLIKTLSPKASATLARRCLQGMIRDFWGVKKGRLVDEIEAIQSQVAPATWAAIDAIRKIGNIGAHMEKDINLVIDVEPEEASLLIGLIEMLINDWYIVKHEREQQMAKIIAAAGAKNQAKTGGTT
jgi:hypothetical protein